MIDLGGAAATTASGTLTGAAAGGLVGALTSAFGLSPEDTQTYEEKVNEGAILLAVPASSAEEHTVTQIFDEFNASDVKTVTNDRDVQRSSRRSYDDTAMDQPMYQQSSHTQMGVKGGTSSQKRKERW